MYTFWLVIKDLFWFALGRVPLANVPEPKSLPPRATAAFFLSTAAATRAPVAETVSNAPLAPSGISTPEATGALLHAPVMMYVCRVDGTARNTAPQQEFDGVVEIVPYGTAVTVVGYRGRYASVLRAGHTGWILKDDLQSDKFSVWPQFTFKQEYLATDPDTIKVRAIIGDQFSAGTLALPLQAGEYITIRLMADHRSILWPSTRPRLPGDWQTILRGVSGIHNSISPKTDAVMEWQTEYGEGRLAYVEAVSPDNTISLSLVGLHDAGQYLTQTLTEAEWRELRPVFIEVA